MLPKHTLFGVHALPGGSPLSGKRTESTRGFTPGPLILFLDQKETTEKKSAIMIKGENYGKEI